MVKKAVRAEDFLGFLKAGEVTPATKALRALATRSWEQRAVLGDLDGVPELFYQLLKRRGYFVGSQEEVAQSLEEIAQMGSGFDLFDLARALAEYDVTLVQCLGIKRGRLLPELRRFVSSCPCGSHGDPLR